MCACDGIEPSDALKRSRGGYRRTVNMIAKERGQVKRTSTQNTRSKKQEMSSSQHTASKRKAITTTKAKKKQAPTKAKKSTGSKHRFQKVGKVRSSKRASNLSTNRKKKQQHSDSSFELNLNDDDTISVNSSSTINAFTINTPAIPEFDLQIEDIEVEKDCEIGRAHV